MASISFRLYAQQSPDLIELSLSRNDYDCRGRTEGDLIMPKKSNLQGERPHYQPTRAHCGQCGRELRYVPFNLNNIMCRDCYGLDRYRKHAPTNTWASPEKPVETNVTDETSTVAK